MGVAVGLQDVHAGGRVGATAAEAQQDALVFVSVVNLGDERVELDWLENDLDADFLQAAK